MLHPRSDVMAVAVPASHGGCGQTHTRPVEDGAPQHPWKFVCPACESFLRDDPAWTVPGAKIPETPDEKAEREERENRTSAELEAQNADAFHRLSEAVAGNSQAMNKLVELLAILGDGKQESAPATRRRTTKTSQGA